MNNCCCVELTVTEDAEVLLSVAEDSQIGLDIEEQFVTGGGITPSGTKEISVTQNGTTNTDVTYYANAKVIANVPNTYTASDEDKVVQDGALEAQTTATFETNDTYDTTTIKQVTVDVPASAVDSGYVYITENGTEDVVGYAQAVVNVPASAVDTGTKNITANGNNQDVVGYAAVNVNVPNTYAAGDEGKVVDNGALVSQTSATYTTNNTYDTTTISSVTVNVSGGSPTLETVTKSYTPTESSQSEQITPSSGYDGLAEVDVTVNAIPSSYVGSGVTRRDSTDLTASGATVTAPAGYYESAATKSVASGTAGTPTATKGTVSNHSVSVTPSVTNSAGYIASETKTGTAVTVSASELVSGSETKTANGTYNVTNLAELVVNVSGGGGADNLPSFIMGTLTQIEDASITIIRDQGFRAYSGLTSLKIPNCTKIGSNALYGLKGLSVLALPSIGGNNNFGGAAIASSDIQILDLGTNFDIIQSGMLQNATKLDTLILRRTTLVTMNNTSQLNGTNFASGKSGGTIYIPKSLYDHLGDETAYDYKAASNWSVIDGYGTITWASIEGSYYETHYADGTVIS